MIFSHEKEQTWNSTSLFVEILFAQYLGRTEDVKQKTLAREKQQVLVKEAQENIHDLLHI